MKQTTKNTKINLLLRGHVRNSFENNKFYLLLRNIVENFECDIYIHTWNIVQHSRSWRHVPENKTQVDEDFLKKYFRDIWKHVKGIMIDDEDCVVLDGNTEGNIGRTPCPVKGYKSMFYGKLRVAEYAFNHVPHHETAVQTRFDILSNWAPTSTEAILNFINNPPITEDRIKFMNFENLVGVENIYLGRVDDIYNFIKYFYYNFDEIYKRHNETGHQEQPVFFERNNF